MFHWPKQITRPYPTFRAQGCAQRKTKNIWQIALMTTVCKNANYIIGHWFLKSFQWKIITGIFGTCLILSVIFLKNDRVNSELEHNNPNWAASEAAVRPSLHVQPSAHQQHATLTVPSWRHQREYVSVWVMPGGKQCQLQRIWVWILKWPNIFRANIKDVSCWLFKCML